jgi:hypothetical protein
MDTYGSLQEQESVDGFALVAAQSPGLQATSIATMCISSLDTNVHINSYGDVPKVLGPSKCLLLGNLCHSHRGKHH